jgi:hypothetical protein
LIKGTFTKFVWSGLGLALALGYSSAFAQYAPQKLNISGALFQPGGAPVTQSSVDFKIEILDKNATCVLYSEEHLGQNLSNSKGAFALEIGSGTSIQNYLQATTSLGWGVFANSGVASGAFAGCAAGVTMNAGDERLIRVSYNLGGGMTAMSPDVTITSASYALVANTLEGKTAAEFVQVKDDGATDLNQSNIETVFSVANYAKLLQLLNNTFSAGYSFNNQRVTNVASPTAATDAVNRGWTDGHVGDKTAVLTGIGAGVGNGSTLIWDAGANQWVTGTPSATDATKLPLAGGTMSGNITMGGFDLANVGNLFIGNQKRLQLGTYTTAQEPALVAGDRGTIVYNTDLNTVRMWNGSAWTAVAPAGASGVAGGDLTGSYPNPSIKDNAVLSAKINTGFASNMLLSTNATTGDSLTYVGCGLNQIMTFDAAGKWSCTTVMSLVGTSGVAAGMYGSATTVPRFGVNAAGAVTSAVDVAIGFPVTQVAGKTGNVVLNAADIGGLGTAALEYVGTGSGNVPQLDAGGKILESLLPDTISRIIRVTAGAGLLGGGTAGDVTVSLDLTNVDAYKIRGRNVAGTAPNNTEILMWNSTTSVWEPQAVPSAPVSSVAGRTGAVVLDAADINSAAGKYFTYAPNNAACATNETLKWNGSAWHCAADNNGGGTITEVAAGVGLTGGGITGAVTINLTNTTVTAAAYGSAAQVAAFTVDAQGRLTAANNQDIALPTTQINQQAASAGEVLKWNGSAWMPAVDTGGIATIDPGNGILISGTATAKTISVDTGITANKILQLDSNGALGIGTASVTAGSILDLYATGSNSSSLLLPRATTADRPSTGIDGMIRYNTSLAKFEVYENGNWFNMATGSTGDNLGNHIATQQIIATPGSIGAPGYAFNGAGNLGMSAVGTSALAFSTGSLERMRLAANGNVGIGTATPNETMVIRQDGNTQNILLIDHPGTLGNHAADIDWATKGDGTRMGSATNKGWSMIAVGDAWGNPYRNDFITYYWSGGAWTSVTTLDSATGNVGVGPAFGVSINYSPVSRMHLTYAAAPSVINAANSYLHLGAQEKGANTFRNIGFGYIPLGATYMPAYIGFKEMDTSGNTMGDLIFGTRSVTTDTAPSEVMRITASGNVGLGTANPAALLDIFSTGSTSSAIVIPRDTAANRPTGINGMIRYNSTSQKFEVYEGVWQNMVSAQASGADNMGNGVATTVVTAITGAAATPSLVFSGDTDTGLWNAGSNMIGISTGGTERVRVDAIGNVAIGTTTTYTKLNVAGEDDKDLGPVVTLHGMAVNQYESGRIRFVESPSGSYQGAFIHYNGSNNTFHIGVHEAGNSLTASDINALSISRVNGNVGIGTATPSALLDIFSTGGFTSAIIVPRQTTAQRPSGINGMIRYNSDLLKFEVYEGRWQIMVGPGSGLDNLGNHTATQQILATVGTGSTPGYSFAGDIDTGIWTAGPNRMILSTGGSERVRIGSSGNVGVGAEADARLQVGSTPPDFPGQGYYLDNWGSSGVRVPAFFKTTNDNGGASLAPPEPALILGREAVSGQSFSNVAEFNLSRFEDVGVLGRTRLDIGLNAGSAPTTAPVVSMFAAEATGSVGAQPILEIRRNNNTGVSYPQMAAFKLGRYQAPTSFSPDTRLDIALKSSMSGATTANIDVLSLQADGRVGIGTTVPAALLDIKGTGGMDSAVIVPRDTAANRPAGLNGMIRYNSTSQKFEVYEGLWQNMISAAGGASDNLGNHAATQAIVAVTGTAATPSYAFAGDTDTGFWVAGENQIAVSSGGTERMRMDLGGNFNFSSQVGIGSSTASTSKTTGALVVTGGMGISGDMYAYRITADSGITTSNSVNSTYNPYDGTLPYPYQGANLGSTMGAINMSVTNGTGAFFRMGVRNSNPNYQYGYIGATSVGGATSYSPNIVFGHSVGSAAFNERMRIDPNGNLGIGTTSPGALLDIYSTGSTNSAVIIPRDTSANRPTGINGMIRYNSTSQKFEVYEGQWQNMITAQGSGADDLGNHTATQQILAVTGTAATPAYTFGGDTDTGIYNAGADQIGFAVNGSERMRLSDYGYLGIGTTVPGRLLDVRGVAGGGHAPVANLMNASATGAGNGTMISFQGASTVSMGYIGPVWNASGNATDFVVATRSSAPAINERMRVTGEGSVGIGTTAPGAELDIAGTGAILVPRNTSSVRPFGLNGMIRYNTTSQKFEVYEGVWQNMITPQASGADNLGNHTATQSIIAIAGTAAAPSYSFTGDSDSGIWSPDQNQTSISTGGTERMRITPEGYIGIGTTTPNFALDVELGRGKTFAKFGDNYPVYIFDPPPAEHSGIGFNLYYDFPLFRYGKGSTSSYGGYVGIIPASGRLDIAVFNVAGTAGASGTPSPGISVFPASSTADVILSPNSYATPFQSQVAIGPNLLTSGVAFEVANFSIATSGTGVGTLIKQTLQPSANNDTLTALRIQPGFSDLIYSNIKHNALIVTSGNVGIGTNTPAAVFDVFSTGSSSAMVIPRDTAANRPSGINGMVRYNTTSQKFEVYQGLWQDMLTPQASGADNLGNGIATTVVQALAGTGSAPSYTFAGDNDTGLSRVGDNRLAFSTGGAERVRVDESGNVGIGTVATDDIHLYRSGSEAGATLESNGSDSILRLKTAAGGTASLQQYSTGLTRLDSGGAHELDLQTWGGGTINISQGSSSRIKVSSTGTVSIGTSAAATSALDIVKPSGAAVPMLRLAFQNGSAIGDGQAIDFSHSTSERTARIYSRAIGTNLGELRFATGNASAGYDDRLTIASDGKVGIGTTGPRTALDTGTGTMSGAANDYVKGQFTMSGGGVVSWAGLGGKLRWTGRFIVLPLSQTSGSAGYVDINQPTSDIPSGQVYDGLARTADANGVVLNAWEALYAAHTVGGNNVAVTYYIVRYTNAFDAPSNWILVAAVNGDDGTVKLGTGQTLYAGGTSQYGINQNAVLLSPGAQQTGNINVSGTGIFGGNVGIGTTTAAARLHVHDTTRGGDIGLGQQSDSTPYLRLGMDTAYTQYLANNAYWTGTQYNYVNTGGYGGLASRIAQTSGIMSFDTASGGANPITWNPRMYIANSGSVGLGTTSPSATLDIVHANSSDGGIKLSSSVADATIKTGRIKSGHYTNAQAPVTMMLASNDAASNILYIGGGSGSETAATTIQFMTASNNTTLTGTQRMSINSSGQTTLTSSSNIPLVMNSSSAVQTALDLVNTSGGGTQMRLQVNSDSTVGREGAFEIWNIPTSKNVFTVLTSGNVGIGTSAPGYMLHVNGSAGKPGGGSWTNSSDERLKDIQGPYERGLNEILKLKPVKYNYSEGNPRKHDPTVDYVGFIAQEVICERNERGEYIDKGGRVVASIEQCAKIFPEAVSKGADGFFDFDMHSINVAMVNAIKQIYNKLLATDDEIRVLREENAELRAAICEINPKAKACQPTK